MAEFDPNDFEQFKKQFYANDELKRQQNAQQLEEQTSGIPMAQLAAGLGSALAGRGPEQAADYFGKQRAQAKADIEGQTQSTRDIVNQYLKKKYYDQAAQDQSLNRNLREQQMNMSSQDRRDAVNEKLAFQREKNEEKKALKEQDLQTPFGLANTKDDAKQLKEGYESKTNFDNKIQELIDLRTKYGGEVFNREAVARGKQLSKDLLLEYKNMAKLGVLSKADEDIINAIIPEDPLGFTMPGQDPIMAKLTKFKEDSNKDFTNKINTRTQSGLSNLQKTASPSNYAPKQQAQPKQTDIDSKVNSFMMKNGIKDKNEAIRILKENGKI